MSGRKPGEKFGGRKKGTPNKMVGGKPTKSRERIMGELMPPGTPATLDGLGAGPGVWDGQPGSPYDPYYLEVKEPLDIMLAIAADVRVPMLLRAKYAVEAAPYVHSRKAVAPYRPPDHDGRIFIEVVEFSKEDFKKP